MGDTLRWPQNGPPCPQWCRLGGVPQRPFDGVSIRQIWSPLAHPQHQGSHSSGTKRGATSSSRTSPPAAEQRPRSKDFGSAAAVVVSGVGQICWRY